MSETYVKLNTQLLIQKNLESLEKVQQSVAKTLEPYNQMTKLMSSYAEQALAINKTLSPAFTQIIEMQQQYNEMMQPIIETLNIQGQMLNPIFESIANTLNNLDISQNPAILQEPASNFFEQEFLEEIPKTLSSLEDEVSKLPESDKMLEIMIFLQTLFMNCDVTIEKIMIYVDFIQLIFSILGVTFPSEEKPQVINIYGDVNIHIEDSNNVETTIEQIIDLVTNE